MCKRYIAVTQDQDDPLKVQVIAEGDDLNKLYTDCEGHVVTTEQRVHIFERISTGKAIRAVEWNGRRRPGGA